MTLTNRGMKETLEELGSCLTQTVGLGKHDNVLEFHIDRVVFDPPEFSRLKTFVSWTVPFSLEDPLQHTNVARGSEANYNYSALYKFQVNSRNLASLREDTVTGNHSTALCSHFLWTKVQIVRGQPVVLYTVCSFRSVIIVSQL